jgi:CRP-like cAMP-binding protein
MIDILRNHIVKRLGSNVQSIETVLAAFKLITVKRNEQILTEGNICRYVYFIAGGCLQVYTHDKDFNETTRDIVIENNWCSELVSFGSGVPATENIRAVEPCDLLAIDRENFQTMTQEIPQFDKIYKHILEASYANSVYRINMLVSLTALERMRWLMEYRPELMTRLSSKLVASYLGINKDVFSRLKAQL